jgi:hypothetical protein
MKTVQNTAGVLIAVALLAGCSERSTTTAPLAISLVATSAGLIGDRPYTWSLSCKSKSANNGVISLGIGASWHWNDVNGVEIDSTARSASCWANGSVSSSDVRPANAYGFSACIGWPSTCQTWTFDPSHNFTAQLKGTDTLDNWGIPVDGILKVNS